MTADFWDKNYTQTHTFLSSVMEPLKKCYMFFCHYHVCPCNSKNKHIFLISIATPIVRWRCSAHSLLLLILSKKLLLKLTVKKKYHLVCSPYFSVPHVISTMDTGQCDLFLPAITLLCQNIRKNEIY